jgi:cell division septation protein DedD
LPKNDEGEFELVLGNRQLISVFVIVVVLLGVFFSMGYIVGRNSPQGAVENAHNDRPKPDADSSDGSSAASSSSNNDATSSDTSPAEGPANSSAANSAPAAPPESTAPAQPETPAPAPARPKASAQEVKPKPSPTPPPASVTASAPVHAAAAGDPAGGEYWQVVATARPDAEIIAEALGKKGFHVVLAPAPKDGIFRVLVGPLASASTQASTRTNLESAGFKNPILRKY